MLLPKLENLFVSETWLRFCAIDLRISFFSFGNCIQKKIQNCQWTSAKQLQFGTVSETRGLAITYGISVEKGMQILESIDLYLAFSFCLPQKAIVNKSIRLCYRKNNVTTALGFSEMPWLQIFLQKKPKYFVAVLKISVSTFWATFGTKLSYF